MQFVIANTFQDSLARLTGDEQKAVKTAAFDLQLNPAHPSLQMHKLDKAKDPRFWSIRVSRDMRLIVHRTAGSLLLCYVDHHDQAYEWAERRKLETHPTTGAAQLVEIRERVHEISIPKYVEAPATKPLLFKALTEEELLRLGVPVDWIPDVQAANEDTILEIAQHLPAEAAEGLLTLATGGKLPEPVFVGRAKTRDKAFTPEAIPELPNPFAHPDAQRRFRVMSNMEELAQALEYPWEKWAVFLHPSSASACRERLQGAGQSCGVGWYWKDDCRSPSSGASCSCESRLKSLADNLLRQLGECAEDTFEVAHRKSTPLGRTNRSSVDESSWDTSIRTQPRKAEARLCRETSTHHARVLCDCA